MTNEYALLTDGREILLVADRGWTVFPGDLSADEYLMTVPRLDIDQGSYNVLLADDAEDTGEWQDWQTHATRLHTRGIMVSVAELRALPYSFEVSDRIREMLRDDQP